MRRGILWWHAWLWPDLLTHGAKWSYWLFLLISWLISLVFSPNAVPGLSNGSVAHLFMLAALIERICYAAAFKSPVFPRSLLFGTCALTESNPQADTFNFISAPTNCCRPVYFSFVSGVTVYVVWAQVAQADAGTNCMLNVHLWLLVSTH